MKSTTIQKWGNSFAVRLPKSTADRLNLHEGQRVCIQESKNGRSLSIIPTEKLPTLEQLLARVTKKSLHSSTEWGDHVGKEVW